MRSARFFYAFYHATLVTFVFTLSILSIFLFSAHVSADSLGTPEITAKSAILIEATTGRVILEKDADAQRYPASLTKMMTGILALENLKPQTDIYISSEAAQTEDTPLGILAGESMRADSLEQGFLMVSDNGGAVALAEAMDGSVAKFATRMNEKAAQLGMDGTHFANPNGLTNPQHYSTARDMATLARYCMKNSDFRRIVGQKNALIPWTHPVGKVLAVENTNKLLGTYPGITGIKTGWTIASGGCLAASATRGNLTLIAVTMGSDTAENRFVDMRKVLDYGFAHTKMVRGLSASRTEKRVWVRDGIAASTMLQPAQDVEYPLIDGEDAKHYSIEYDVPKVVNAPIESGQNIGTLILLYDGRRVGTIPMKATEPVVQGFSVGSFLVRILAHILA